MKNKGTLLNLIIVGMTLGTTWAIRGQFGHEQGAAWAGGVDVVCHWRIIWVLRWRLVRLVIDGF